MEIIGNGISESRLRFSFDKNTKAIKFDETEFYRKKFNALPGSKGVDIIAESEKMIQFIEIKNCLGHESENVWRTSIDNRRLESAPRDLDVESRNSLDIEVAKKVASTISCLYGAWTESQHMESSFELSVIWEKLNSGQIPTDKKQLWVILFLEGSFGQNGPRGRSKTMVMKRIQDSIKKKLAWLNCRVTVVDSNTYNKSLFKVEKL